MNKTERFIKAFNYLKGEGIIKKQEDLANIMKAGRSNISMALKGRENVLTEKFIVRFVRSFPGIFSLDWLLTGDGKMLIKDMEVEELNPSSLSTQNEKDIEYLRNELKSKDELIAELRKRIDTQEMLISVLQARISDLQSTDPFYFTPGVAEIPTHKK